MSRLSDAIKEYQEGTFKKKAPVEVQKIMLEATKKLENEGISKYAPKNELEFEVLSDIGNKVAKKIGLVFSLADELKPIYEKFGINIPASNDDTSFNLPMPAIFIINKNAEIIFSFVNEDYTKRCEPQDILNTIKNNI